MNEKLIKLLEKIIESEEIQHNLQNQNTLEEAYQYCLSIKEGYTIDEFQDFLREIVRLNGKVVKSELSEKNLKDITGGLLLNSKKEMKILSALLGSALILPGSGLVNAQENNFNVQAAESSIEISEEVSENKTENIFDNLSEKSKKALSALAEWAEKFVGSILDATSPKVEAMTYPELDDFYGPDSKNLYPKISEDDNWSNPSNLPTASPLTYGQKLSESTLSGGTAGVQGKFVWKDGNKIPDAGTDYYDVKFIPDNRNYKSQDLRVKLTVQKATPLIHNWPVSTEIDFGSKLKDSELRGGSAGVQGEFVWQEEYISPDPGVQAYTVLFKPRDTKNYFEVYNYVYVKVNKIYPKIYRYPSISSLHYGQNLSDAKFENGRTNVKGTFSWKKDEKKMKVGTYTKTVVFTPDDTKHYKKVEYDVKFEVGKAPIEIYGMPTASSIVHGDSLSKSIISKVKSNVPGVLKWVEPYKRPQAGKAEFPVIVVPLDKENYKPKTIYVSVTVKKATPKLDVNNISVEYTPNLTLKNISLPKGWSWEMPDKCLDRVGEYNNLTVVYREDSNYSSAVAKINLFVDRGNPKLSIEPVNYEKYKTLDSISLPKGWHWNNPKELLLTEKSVYSAYYDSKEAESDLYRDQEKVNVTIKVNKSQPKIVAWPHPSKDVVFGEDLESSDLVDGKSSEEGIFRLKDSVRNLHAGTHLCKVVFVPFDKGYNEVEDYIKVKIVKNTTPMNVPSEINENKITKADTSINLNIDDKDSEYEYSKDGGETWQNSSEFVDLTPKTEYKFVYRYKDTDSHCTGKISREVKISTKSSAPDAPTDFKVKSKTNHKIVFEDNKDLEYSIDEGNTWQDSPVFDNLSGSTEYSFIARVKETNEHVSGVNSEIVKIKTYSWISNLYHKIFG